MNLRFEKLSENIVMSGGKRYTIPIIPEVNCIRIKAGMISFGSVNFTIRDFFCSKKKVRFWRVPSKTKIIVFPDFKKNESGYHYGEPKWFNH